MDVDGEWTQIDGLTRRRLLPRKGLAPVPAIL